MKKVFLGACLFSAALMFESCYSSSVYYGDVTNDMPLKKVETRHNAHFFGGLIGEGKIRKKYVLEGVKDYKVKHQITFTDGLLSYITAGIYTPSTTKFYLPEKDARKYNRGRNGFDD